MVRMSYKHDKIAKAKRRLRESGDASMSVEQRRRVAARERIETFMKGKNHS